MAPGMPAAGLVILSTTKASVTLLISPLGFSTLATYL